MLSLVATLLSIAPAISVAATISASSCSQSDVTGAIGRAANGDVVSVPAGSCSWSGISINKPIHLQGAGIGKTNITITGSASITIQPSDVIRISGFRFTKNSGGNNSYAWIVSGAWGNKPLLFHDNEINVSNSAFFHWDTPGGGVLYKNDIKCQWDESVLKHKNLAGLATWNKPDTLGTRDSTGAYNLYLEDNTWKNCTNQGVDFDDASRSVFRYNTLVGSSWNSHGFATSAVGNRHFEIYNNNFGEDERVNQNWQIWIRGGTGVIFDNVITDLNGSEWGNKPEVLLSVRAASDGGGQYPNGCCNTYPCIRQVGQNHDGSRQFTDPIRLWNNAGGYSISTNQSWGSCGGPANEFMQNGRDYVSGSPRQGYTPYPYPHPLRAESARPQPPSGVRAE
jgi:hypothetical protein